MGQPVSLAQYLAEGLIPESRHPANVPGMVTHRNMQVTPYGAGPVPTMNALIASLPSAVSMPYPQLFRGKGVTLLCYQTAIYTVDESNWTTSALGQPYKFDATSTQIAIPSGGMWHFVDFYGTWFLFNGSCILFKSQWVDSTKLFIVNYMTVKTACDFKGRMIYGGFATADFYSSTSGWPTLWENWIDQTTDWGFVLGAPGVNWVGWSSIGEADLIVLFLASLASGNLGSIGSGYDTNRPRFLERLKLVQSGFMPLDWPGNVLAVRALRDRVVVFGQQNTSAIFPATVGDFPTFGLRDDVLKVGLLDRGAVCGDLEQIWWISTEGVLYTMTAGGQLARLGFESHLAVFLGGSVAMVMDPARREVHISNGTYSFHLSGEGKLSSGPKLISGGARIDKGAGAYGQFYVIGTNAADVTTITLETETIEFATVQTIQKVGLVSTGSETATFKIKHYTQQANGFTTSASYTPDNRGQTVTHISCLAFRIQVNLTVSSVYAASYKLHDLWYQLNDEKVSVKARIV